MAVAGKSIECGNGQDYEREAAYSGYGKTYGSDNDNDSIKGHGINDINADGYHREDISSPDGIPHRRGKRKE